MKFSEEHLGKCSTLVSQKEVAAQWDYCCFTFKICFILQLHILNNTQGIQKFGKMLCQIWFCWISKCTAFRNLTKTKCWIFLRPGNNKKLRSFNFFFVIKMHLTNIFSLTGLMFLLWILHTMEMSFGMACFLLLSKKNQKNSGGWKSKISEIETSAWYIWSAI